MIQLQQLSLMLCVGFRQVDVLAMALMLESIKKWGTCQVFFLGFYCARLLAPRALRDTAVLQGLNALWIPRKAVRGQELRRHFAQTGFGGEPKAASTAGQFNDLVATNCSLSTECMNAWLLAAYRQGPVKSATPQMRLLEALFRRDVWISTSRV